MNSFDEVILFLIVLFLALTSLGADARRGSQGVAHSIDDPGIPPVGNPSDVSDASVYLTH